jgi:hypothetical protein
MKTQILLWSVVSIFTTAIAADSAKNGAASDSGPLPAITLTNGTKLTLLGVTHGKHHVAPHYEAIGGNLRTGNWIDRANDTTVVWLEIEHDPAQSPSYALLVSDKAITDCITSEVATRCHVKTGVEVHGFVLQAYPRWDTNILLRVASAYGHELSKEPFIINNPDLRPFGGALTLKPLPNTQSDGDVEVTLTNLVTGAPLPPYQRQNNTSQDDPQSKCVRIGFDFKQKGQSVTNWRPWLVDLSDTAGNHLETTMQFQDNDFMRQHTIPSAHPLVYGPNDDYKGYYFKPGLWPDEPAWKVRLEFTRTSGFSDDEILTLTNIPVRRGDQKDWDAEWTWEPGQTDSSIGNYTVSGITFKLFPPLLRPDPYQTNQLRLDVIMRSNPRPDLNRIRIALLGATDDQGRELWDPFGPAAWYNSTFEFTNPHEDLKALNLKFAVHKSRFVEFVVKPTKQ